MGITLLNPHDSPVLGTLSAILHMDNLSVRLRNPPNTTQPNSARDGICAFLQRESKPRWVREQKEYWEREEQREGKKTWMITQVVQQ